MDNSTNNDNKLIQLSTRNSQLNYYYSIKLIHKQITKPKVNLIIKDPSDLSLSSLFDFFIESDFGSIFDPKSLLIFIFFLYISI